MRPRRPLIAIPLVSGIVLWPSLVLAAPPGRLEPPREDQPWNTGDAPPGTTTGEGDAAPPPEEGGTPPESPEGPAEEGPMHDPFAPGAPPPEERPPEPEPAEPAAEKEPSAEAPQPEPINEDIKHPVSIDANVGDKPMNLTLYGMVVANGVFNSGTPGPSQEAPTFARAGSLIGDGLNSDQSFLITARQSRFGMTAKLQLTEKVDLEGKIETDFFGVHETQGPGAVMQTALRLRHAYIDVGGKKVRFLVGQSWSVVTPRLPTSLGHMVIALHTLSGAVWQRVPQLTLIVRQPVGNEEGTLGHPAITFKASAVRSFSADGEVGFDRFDTPDPGTLSGLPGGQARFAFESDHFVIGVGGHGAAELYERAELSDPDDTSSALILRRQLVEAWMVTADLRIATKYLDFNASGHYGANINGMFSLQGVRAIDWNVTDTNDSRFGQVNRYNALPAVGGWAEFVVPLGTPKVKLLASGGMDLGDESEVAPGRPWLNTGAFGGILYAPHPNFDMSLEYLRSMTWFRGPEGVDNPPAASTMGVNDNITTNFRFKF